MIELPSYPGYFFSKKDGHIYRFHKEGFRQVRPVGYRTETTWALYRHGVRAYVTLTDVLCEIGPFIKPKSA
ncbi:MAG: hypothetical protein A2X86_10375 [Bdellovibrionales bacterium GWA2_49_15]|nr:MAG: hypothetical protein A2X86_10375 [Bdellovibrionales bacterium GWA2_49_15]